MSILTVCPKKGDASTFALREEKIRIGRDLSNDIVLSDQFSSGCHAVIIPTADGYAIEDQKSKNGTFLNGSRLGGKAPLSKGDEILIGSTRIFFDRESETEVTVTDESTPTQTTNKIIKVRDILKKQPQIAYPSSETGSLDLEQLQRDHRLVAILGEVSQALIYNMPLNDLLSHVMDLITQNIPMDRGVLMLKEDGLEELVPKVVRIQNAWLKTQSITVSRSILRTAVESNSAVLISDIQSDKQLSEKESVVAAQIHSAMCVPLWNNKEIIGLIYSDRTALLGRFTEEDLKLLTVLANLAALKIENARLFEESQERARMEQELVMAHQIQMNFLPRCDPVFEPYDISGSTKPCHHVGGDYFDFIPMDPSELGLVIADVSGHGISAGLLMTSLKSSLHALIPTTKDLAMLAAKLNNTVYGDSDIRTFISFFFGALSCDKGEMSYVNAGHNPPLLLGADGQVRFLDSTGFCLGMFPNASYQIQTIGIRPGEILCLFTDGIVEGRNSQNEEFGDERLIQQLRGCAKLPAQEMLTNVYEGVLNFTGRAELSDDLTLMVIKRKLQESE
jgi:serine phosphatase RsbU (regulator of sigma subunit)/pSer/pThr/pTyr-binding forkhead associated (FHA) protein